MTYLTTKEAAEYLRKSHRTLQGYRRKEEGPPYSKPNKNTVRYRVEDLDAWMAANEVAI
jgi:hypothetical protein